MVKEFREELLEKMRGIRARMASIEETIAKSYPLHVKPKWKRCGKKCRCQKGILHGPYLYGYYNHPEAKEKRRQGKKSTRKEFYLGLKWTPPEGWIRPRELQELLREYKVLRQELEYLADLVYGNKG